MLYTVSNKMGDVLGSHLSPREAMKIALSEEKFLYGIAGGDTFGYHLFLLDEKRVGSDPYCPAELSSLKKDRDEAENDIAIKVLGDLAVFGQRVSVSVEKSIIIRDND